MVGDFSSCCASDCATTLPNFRKQTAISECFKPEIATTGVVALDFKLVPPRLELLKANGLVFGSLKFRKYIVFKMERLEFRYVQSTWFACL